MIFEDFLSPKQCELIIDQLNFTVPDLDKDGKPMITVKGCEPAQEVIYEKFKTIIQNIESHYGLIYSGTEKMLFEWLSPGVEGQPGCDNSAYTKSKKWFRRFNRDVSCVLFLSSYQDAEDFDPDFEVYGGKLEFPQHGFGFNPQRGTLIIYPSGPHFINATTKIEAGNLMRVKFFAVADLPYLYNPEKFPGSWRTWFSDN